MIPWLGTIVAAFALISGLVEIVRAFEPIPRGAAGGVDSKAE